MSDQNVPEFKKLRNMASSSKEVALMYDTVPKKKIKKIYTPNLNVERKKNSKALKNKIAQRRTEFIHKSKNPNLKKQKYIQLAGVFSDRCEKPGKKNLFKRGPSLRSRQNIKNRNMKSTYLNLQNVPRSLEDDISETISSYESSESEEIKGGLEPIDLPCQYNKTKLTSTSIKIEKSCSTTKSIKSKYDSFSIPFLHRKMYSSEHPSLSVFKLPECLPYISPSDNNHCSLRDLEEGKVGNLLIRQSGKMEAQIGTLKYILHDNSPLYNNFTLCNYSKQTDDCLGSFVSLGKIENWFMMTPDWRMLTLK